MFTHTGLPPNLWHPYWDPFLTTYYQSPLATSGENSHLPLPWYCQSGPATLGACFTWLSLQDSWIFAQEACSGFCKPQLFSCLDPTSPHGVYNSWLHCTIPSLNSGRSSGSSFNCLVSPLSQSANQGGPLMACDPSPGGQPPSQALPGPFYQCMRGYRILLGKPR